MAISYPRSIPEPIRRVTFNLKHFVKGSGMGGPVVDSRDPLWVAEYDTPPLTNLQLVEWRAWWVSLRGGIMPIYGYDPKLPYPVRYPGGVSSLTRAGGGAFDGTATITAIATRSITLGTLPAGFILTAGDKIGLIHGTRRSLHMIVESVTANGSGVATVSVEPKIPTTIFSTSSTANLVRPVCRMMVVADSWSNPTDIDAEPISFAAEQQGF
jgi:hypothetical protein